jgi:superfamily II DNA or RNA helicase
MDNIIYSLYHSILTKDHDLNINGRKIGSTKHIISRMRVYQTGYPIQVPLECYYKIDKDCYEIDNNINNHFEKSRLNYKGSKAGTEFYNADELTLDVLETYFHNNNIKFIKYNSDNIINEINIITKEDYEIINNENKLLVKNYLSKELRLRNKIQEEYIIDINKELIENNKCFIKAPTGFGKTHIFYKVLKENKYNKILILTPRLLLNEQIVEDKYSLYIKDYNYKICHYSHNDNKKQLIKNMSKYKENFIMTSCYQSCKNLIKYCNKYKLLFDIIIFDEAHFITSWINSIDSISSNSSEDNSLNFLLDCNITKHKIFGSATPTEEIENNSIYFGKIIEKVKVHELINNQILCDIETIIKKMDNKKKDYHNLKDLIIESMIKYNKKKGIVYVNDTTNAENLYKLMKTQDIINSYVYVSKELSVDNENDTSITAFEEDNQKSIIIVVGKLGYGYDNDYIDFICLGDPRQSDIDIRQILGRGLRWNKHTYPNKILHLLVPLYQDEFGEYKKNEHLKKYLDYIIGECDKDFIIKDGLIYIGDGKNKKKDGEKYDGDNVDIEIMNEYCTTGYNKFTDFQRFLRNNNIYDEKNYNKLKNTYNWMPDLGNIYDKYPKFCFRNIHPNNNKYYWDKLDAEKAYIICNTKLIEIIGKDKYKRLNSQQKLEKINELDNRIPNMNLNLYYNHVVNINHQ